MPMRAPADHPAAAGDPWAPLSAREAEIVALAVQGLGNEEIARRLVISTNTLKSHLRRAYRKIGVTTREQAVAWVTGRGLA
jgi:DNA-binding CsgD family transcriptional regulator